MKRIMVIGVSAGAGKSTLAREISSTLGIDVYHLDCLYWRPGWVESPIEEFRSAQQEIIAKDKWIIEGNYGSTFMVRSERADTMVYIEFPLYVCFYRVVKRWLTNLGKNRPDMADGCPEKLDWKFIKFIATTYHERKKTMEDRLKTFQALDSGKQVFILRNNKQIRAFLKAIKEKYEHTNFSEENVNKNS
ncbi:topology modulation protein [Anaerobacillus sp. CMMVII]|uniref:topology modulation protein n=1 Tax=Anaerobacillus sp. CMMVII TaxID=2755588 RepID=UPI0021B782E4|nr:topology modulation protein [Anaerobacillus sp. CMMVII]MCT8137185.1 topology modulation protein [Anaerobacillus sp. CMMVII]